MTERELVDKLAALPIQSGVYVRRDEMLKVVAQYLAEKKS